MSIAQYQTAQDTSADDLRLRACRALARDSVFSLLADDGLDTGWNPWHG